MPQANSGIKTAETQKDPHSAYYIDQVGLFSWWKTTDLDKDERYFVVCQRWFDHNGQLQLIELLERDTGTLIQVPYLQFYKNITSGKMVKTSPDLYNLPSPPPVPPNLLPDRFC